MLSVRTLFLLYTSLQFTVPIQLAFAQECVQANSDGADSLPSFGDPGNGAERINITPIQAIIKSYEFHCCGAVGGWAAYVHPGGNSQDDDYNIKFQIWRPVAGSTNSYVKIGENTFNMINLDSESAIEETTPSNERLQFQPGDVVGYYLEQQGDCPNDGGIQFDENFDLEEFFYVTGRPHLQDECTLAVGNGGELSSSTSLGPIISISVSTTADACQSSFTSTMTCLAPTPTAQNCLQTNDGPLPLFCDPGRDAPRINTTPLQAIVKSYEFHCCGTVTEWVAFVEPGGGMHTGQYNINFQIWRPQGSNSYTKIGENKYTMVVLDPSSEISETVPLNEQIEIQQGDVIGYYLEQQGGSDDDGGIQFDAGFTNEEYYYVTRNSNLKSMDTLTIGAGGDLSLSTTLGPIISVSFVISSCPISTPAIVMTTMAPSSTIDVVMSSTPPPPDVQPTSTEVMSSTPPSPDMQPTTTEAAQPSSTLCDAMSPCPVSTTSVMMPTSTPSPSPSPTPSTTEGPEGTPTDGTDMTASTDDEGMTTTTEGPAPAGSDNSLVIGFVVALLVVISLAVMAIVIVVVLMRRRQSKQASANVTGHPSAWSNPSYEDPISINGNSATKSKKKKPKPKAKPLSINTSGDGSIYETLEGEYQAIPAALDYTYPTPSPTVKYNPKMDEVTIPDKNAGSVYHDIGPDVGNQYDYCGPGTYHTLEPTAKSSFEASSASAHYEDPTLPKFRTNTLKNDPFEGEGIYVPTLAQRQAMGGHYELPDSSMATYNKLQFFVEDQTYWAPADTASDLYQQLASKKYREIPRNQIQILEELGSGQFGQVCKGIWSISDNTLQLAVKTLKPNAPEDDKVKFLQEAAIMGQFLHPNVVKLYGVVTVGQPVMICLEIMSNGDLRSYLRSIDIGSNLGGSKDLQLLFLRFAKEISAGMDYLSTKAFVHRDLAARNVLVNEGLTCKIGDFGMARDLMDDTYYTSKGGKIPVKWTAPEALLYKKYSTDSDIWSYGMVLFEIWSVGKKPFSMHTNNEVLRLIQSGYVQAPPPGCPREMYRLMVDCWNPEHQYRPKFSTITSRLQAPASKLLFWSPQDSKVSDRAAELGASLEEGYKLHEDLREKYKQYESL